MSALQWGQSARLWSRALPAHQRVFAAFFLYAFGLGGLFARMGEFQLQIGAGKDALGLALIGTACGTMVSLSLGHRPIERVGYRRCLLVLPTAIAACYAVAAWASGPLALFLMLLPAGLAVGALEVVVNVEADRVEHQLGRRIMSRAHAFWSFGFFAAAALGVLAAWLGLSLQLQLALAAVLVAALSWLLFEGFVAAPHRPSLASAEAPLFASPTPAIAALVALTFSAMVMEGAGIDWSSIYMREVFAVSPFVAGLAVAAGSLTQALARFYSDAWVEQLGPVRFARGLLSAMALGTALVTWSTSPGLSLLGFALLGLGTSAIFPLAMSSAAQLGDRPAAVNVAALAQTSFVAFLLAPPLLGVVAEAWGIRWSFGLGLPLILMGFLASSSLRPKSN